MNDELQKYGNFFQDLYCRYQLEFGLLAIYTDNIETSVRLNIIDQLSEHKRKSDIVVIDQSMIWIFLPKLTGRNMRHFRSRIVLWLKNLYSDTPEGSSWQNRFIMNDSKMSYGNFYSMIESTLETVRLSLLEDVNE